MKMENRTLSKFLLTAIVSFATAIPTVGQAPFETSSDLSVVPKLSRYSAQLPQRYSGTIEMVFAVYSAAEGGEPLWTESQQVAVGPDGTYSVMLGAVTQGGLPASLFSAGKARWLGIAIDREPEQPRVPLDSAPYAMKAADAETLSGVSATEFVTQTQMRAGALAAAVAQASADAARPETAPSGSGTTGQIALWSSSSALGNSSLTQTGTGAAPLIGVNTATPLSTLDVNGVTTLRNNLVLSAVYSATSSAALGSPALQFNASSFLKGGTAVGQNFVWEAVPTGNNTSAPSASLNLLFGAGTAAPAATGLAISPKGIISFATGQTFPGTSSSGGTITGVTATSPLTGGGTTGSVSMGLNTTALEATLNSVYAQLGAANTFTKPITFAPGQTFPGASSGSGTITGVTATSPLTGGGTTGSVSMGLNTTALETTLNSVYAQLGAANTFTKPITFAPGQTFPGASSGGGTITGVTATSPLTGGGTTGSVSLGLNATALESTLNGVYAQLGAANTFVSPTTFAAPVTFASGQTFPWGGAGGVTGTVNSTATGSAGVTGTETAATGTVSGVFGVAQSTGAFSAGVNGTENATTGNVAGVSGTAYSTTTGAAGVNGNAAALTGQVSGVNGYTSSVTTYAAGVNGYEGATTGQVFGVSGSTYSTTDTAAGVSGYEGAATGNVFGVTGQTQSSSGYGVFGGAWSATGRAVGVYGQSNSASGVGLVGFVQQPGATGAELFNASGAGNIIAGFSGANYTQVFSVDANGNGFFSGNLNVNGTLAKGGGSFKIDHPLDPANKYLSHSFVESPDMMNVYNGNIVTDKHGLATVELPEYFEALNRDFRYQLTVIGQFAQAIVAQEIGKNHFVIRTNKPGVKVSWQVTGIRQDAYANANRIRVEEAKPSSEQGYYLHPEVFGQPASRSIAAAGQSDSSSATGGLNSR
jgi:hypothetical protein